MARSGSARPERPGPGTGPAGGPFSPAPPAPVAYGRTADGPAAAPLSGPLLAARRAALRRAATGLLAGLAAALVLALARGLGGPPVLGLLVYAALIGAVVAAGLVARQVAAIVRELRADRPRRPTRLD